MASEGSQPVAPTVHSYDLRSARRPDDVPPTDARGIRATQESAPMPPRMTVSRALAKVMDPAGEVPL